MSWITNMSLTIITKANSYAKVIGSFNNLL